MSIIPKKGKWYRILSGSYKDNDAKLMKGQCVIVDRDHAFMQFSHSVEPISCHISRILEEIESPIKPPKPKIPVPTNKEKLIKLYRKSIEFINIVCSCPDSKT